jgi:hypothetical protein
MARSLGVKTSENIVQVFASGGSTGKVVGMLDPVRLVEAGQRVMQSLDETSEELFRRDHRSHPEDEPVPPPSAPASSAWPKPSTCPVVATGARARRRTTTGPW